MVDENTLEEMEKYKLQACVIKKQSQDIKQKLKEYFSFEIEKYLILDIVENETYHHFCSMVNLSVVNDRLSAENGEILKEGIKELFEIAGDYDRLDKSILIDCSDEPKIYDDYYIKKFIDVNKYLDETDKVILKKLSIPFKKALLTSFEFMSLRVDIAEYCFDGDENIKGMDLRYCKNLKDTEVSEEEYVALANKIEAIANEYGIF